MAFKMKYGKKSGMGFPFKESPMKSWYEEEGTGPVGWLRRKAGQAKDWFKESVVETVKTGKDPAERWQEAQRHNRLTDPRNRSEHAKIYQQKLKKEKEKKEFKKHGVKGMMGGLSKGQHAQK